MEFRAEQVGSALILRLDGQLTAESETTWMQNAVGACTAPGVRHALLDLAGVSRLDCAGIGRLLALRERVHRARRTFGLVDVERRQKHMLKVAGLVHVFRTFDDRDAAVSALGLGGGQRREDPDGRAASAPVCPRGPATTRWTPATGWARSECVS
jgi:anti-anti-sigma factor